MTAAATDSAATLLVLYCIQYTTTYRALLGSFARTSDDCPERGLRLLPVPLQARVSLVEQHGAPRGGRRPARQVAAGGGVEVG